MDGPLDPVDPIPEGFSRKGAVLDFLLTNRTHIAMDISVSRFLGC